MTKKVLISIIALLYTLFFTSFAFATTSMENGAKDVGTEVKDSFDKLEGGAKDMGNTVKDAITDVGNAMTDNKDNLSNNSNDNSYTATRTSATSNTSLFGMSTNTMWTWLILAIVAVAIVSLLWFYGSQNNTTRNNK